MKFVVDSMLGRLATWLRVLGYDTHYQSYYLDEEIVGLMRQNRWLATRRSTRWEQCRKTACLHSEQVGEQLKELLAKLELQPEFSGWFTRCLRCNVILETVADEEAMEKVPEYVFYQSRGKIKVCRSCGRYFWPGSHRKRMLKQLTAWGFAQGNDSSDLT